MQPPHEKGFTLLHASFGDDGSYHYDLGHYHICGYDIPGVYGLGFGYGSMTDTNATGGSAGELRQPFTDLYDWTDPRNVPEALSRNFFREGEEGKKTWGEPTELIGLDAVRMRSLLGQEREINKNFTKRFVPRGFQKWKCHHVAMSACGQKYISSQSVLVSMSESFGKCSGTGWRWGK